MKLSYLNDTNRPIRLHVATEIHGVQTDMSPIEPQEIRYFMLPDGVSPFLKLWDYGEYLVLLVSYTTEEG